MPEADLDGELAGVTHTAGVSFVSTLRHQTERGASAAPRSLFALSPDSGNSDNRRVIFGSADEVLTR